VNCLFSSHADADKRDAIERHLKDAGFHVTNIVTKDDIYKLDSSDYQLLISDRTKFLFPSEFIDLCKCPRINTHPSLLPYHKGSQPVFWATVLNHKLGISLHSIDASLDGGEIYLQSEVIYDQNMTLADAHRLCRKRIEEGIIEVAQTVVSGKSLKGYPQPSYCNEHHRLKDAVILMEKLPDKWNTTIIDAREILAADLEEMHIVRSIYRG